MALRLFENDPQAAPKKFTDDIVGRFRSGYQVNKRPASLEKWRLTTGDPEVAGAIQALLGGEDPQSWAATGEDNLEVFTEADSLDILVGKHALRSEMALWGRNNKAVRRCDGVEQGDPNKGAPCACPHAFSERKAAAKDGTGCEPSISVVFRLAGAPDLGKFRFTSGSWTLARDIGAAEDALAAVDGDTATGTLSLVVVEYESQGKQRRFVKPVITITGSVDA